MTPTRENESVFRLLERVRHIEDFVAISTLIATYGPAIDSDSRVLAQDLWQADGDYDLNHRMYGSRQEIRARFLDQRNMDFVSRSAHPSTPPRISIRGDRAIAINYQQLFRLSDEYFDVGHQNVSIWHFERTGSEWKIYHRALREANGNGESTSLLVEQLDDAAGWLRGPTNSEESEVLDSSGPVEVDQSVDVTALNKRIRALEDFVEISTIIATYGPAIDSDSRDLAAELWTEDGIYDLNHRIYTGHDELRQNFLGGPRHQGNLASGCAHPSTAPKITIEGDTATAICYQHLVRLDDGSFHLVRQNASVWHMVRTNAGWRAKHRVLRSTDGSGESSALLREALGTEE